MKVSLKKLSLELGINIKFQISIANFMEIHLKIISEYADHYILTISENVMYDS